MRQDLYTELYQVENSHWWHRHKRKVVHQLINKFCHKKGRILDVGAGAGKILQEMKQAGWQVSGVDIEKQAQIESAKRGISVKLTDVSKNHFPFKDNSFDSVLALDLLEHLADNQRCLGEMKRVLKTKGIIIISVPAYEKLFSYWDKMVGHYRRYSAKSLQRLCRKNDLKIIFLSYYFSFLIIPALIIRLTKKLINLEKKSDFQTNPLPKLIVPFIKILSKMEQILLRYVRLPFGLSLICVAQKK